MDGIAFCGERKTIMKLTLLQHLQRYDDRHRQNMYALKKYLLKDGKTHPVAVICPGGGYGSVSGFLEGYPYAKQLNKMGISAVVVYYRIREKAKFPAPQDDLACAVREVISHAKEWNLDIDGYSVWGSSAGGHLAATFGTEALGYAKYNLPRPAAIVLAYPVVTMTVKTHFASRERLLGKKPKEEMIRLCSVEQQVTNRFPPTFLWCGDADSTVDPENSRMLHTALRENGIPCQMRVYPGVGHAVGLGRGTASFGWICDAVAFWKAMMREDV